MTGATRWLFSPQFGSEANNHGSALLPPHNEYLKIIIPTLASQNRKGNGRSKKPVSVFSIHLKVFQDGNPMLVARTDGGREEAFSASASKCVKM